MPNPDDEVVDPEAAPIPDGLASHLPSRADIRDEVSIVGLHDGDPNISLSDLRDFLLEYEDGFYSDLDDELTETRDELAEIIPDGGIDGEVLANVLIPKKTLKHAITSNPLFGNVGMETKEKIFDRAEIRFVPHASIIIGPDTKDQGMFMPVKKGVVEIFDVEGNKVGRKVLDEGNYIGEYALVGLQPTANIVNMSGESKFIYISNELFESLHIESRLEMLEELLRNSPLVKYSQENPAETSSEIISVSEPRHDVAALFSKLLLKPSKHEAFPSFKVVKYQVGEEITPPDKNFLGLISEGGLVSVNRVNEGGVGTQIAEIQHFNTLFEANAVGVQPHSSIKLIADKETTVVYVNVARDNTNYEKCMAVALRGQAAKLSGSNVRVGMLKRD